MCPCVVNAGAQRIEGFHQVRSVSRWLDLVEQDYVRIGPAQKGPKLPLLGGKCITRDIPGQDSLLASDTFASSAMLHALKIARTQAIRARVFLLATKRSGIRD